MSIDIKAAVRDALDFVAELYANEELTLEEAELSEDGARWLVTVGIGHQERASTMSVVTSEGNPRRHKRLEIDVETGRVIAIKARAM